MILGVKFLEKYKVIPKTSNVYLIKLESIYILILQILFFILKSLKYLIHNYKIYLRLVKEENIYRKGNNYQAGTRTIK